MSIEKMTSMSHFLFAISIVFAVMALVLFFALDIVRCWKMVYGRHPARGKGFHKARPENKNKINAEDVQTEELKTTERLMKNVEKTQPLKHCFGIMPENGRETLPLAAALGDDGSEETLLLKMKAGENIESGQTALPDTMELELIQDILYGQERTVSYCSDRT